MNADWYEAYWRDKKYPAGMDGHSYVRGRRPMRGDLVKAVRHLRKIKKPTRDDIGIVIRLHRVGV